MGLWSDSQAKLRGRASVLLREGHSSIPLVCTLKCPRAKYWTPTCSWFSSTLAPCMAATTISVWMYVCMYELLRVKGKKCLLNALKMFLKKCTLWCLDPQQRSDYYLQTEVWTHRTDLRSKLDLFLESDLVFISSPPPPVCGLLQGGTLRNAWHHQSL